MEGLKLYQGVYFPTNNNYAVVPRTWLKKLKNKFKCHWPTKGKPEVLVEQNVMPDEKWPLYTCKLVTSSSKFIIHSFIYIFPT